MRTVTNVIYAKDVIYACRKHVIYGETSSMIELARA